MLSRWGTAGHVGMMARRRRRIPTTTANHMVVCSGVVRGMSSSSTSSSSSSVLQSASQSRLERTLYRQLIKWCRITGWNVPLDAIPPVTLVPPRIDAQALQSFSQQRQDATRRHDIDMKHMNDLLPPGSVMDDLKVVLPVRHVRDIERVIRLAYRLNHPSPVNTDTTSSTTRQQRISLAFDAMKSLNQLTDALDQKKQSRSQHTDRTGVPYFVGQVVRHKEERWRAVVVEWDRVEAKKTKNTTTSLTKKDYTRSDAKELDSSEKEDKVQYTLILDHGDAHLLGGRPRTNNGQTGLPVAFASDLEPVLDKSLQRIRSNWVATKFERFDSVRSCFVPKKALAYEYPSDGEWNVGGSFAERNGVNDTNTPVVIDYEKMTTAVQTVASQLERCILDVTSCTEARGLTLLASFQHKLSSLTKGDVETMEERLNASIVSNDDDASSEEMQQRQQQRQSKILVAHLRSLLYVTLELLELLRQRRIAMQRKHEIQFPLGSIVRHAKYKFRGVVVAWDPKAAVDVSNWDGLQDITGAADMPFYHVIPDQNDCVDAFGSERPFRYVCQANLELCPRHQCILNVDDHLDPEWKLDTDEFIYQAPDDVKFKYGESLGGDEELIESCLTDIKNTITQFQLGIRGEDTDSTLKGVTEILSLDNLMLLLQSTNSMEDAIVVEETIKETFKAHSSEEIRYLLDDGIAELLHGNHDRARGIFLEIVKLHDPSYYEAWNKLATCHYMLGDMIPSIEATQEVVRVQPQHFQALNGLGLVQYECRQYQNAIDSFRKSIQVDPWSPVSSRLAVCIDLVKTLDLDTVEDTHTEDEASEEGTAPYEK